MKLSLQIPITTAFLLLLTLVINVIGLQFSLEKHFPDYVESMNKKIEDSWLSPNWLQAFLSVNSLDENAKNDYQNAISELARISSSLESVSKNPELYVANSWSATANSFHISDYTNLLEQAKNDWLLQIFTHPFSLNSTSPEAKFIFAIIKNFLILNAIWIIFVIILYALWIRRLFRPIHFIIQSLRNFSHHKGQNLLYSKRDEFRPLIDSLNNFRDSLDRQDQIRNNFLSDISHEIKTPITAISGFLEAIEDGIIELDAKNIKILQSEISRLIRITEGIMKHEKFLHSLDSDFEKEEINIRDQILQILPQYDQKLAKNLQKIEILFQKSPKILVQGEYFSQILHNIFSNFRKYAWENALLKIDFSENNSHKILTFSDNGKWMKSDEIIFAKEKFYRADSGRNQQNNDSSMWIGLSIVEKIMNIHDGILEISSNSPSGFILTLSFPKNEKSS